MTETQTAGANLYQVNGWEEFFEGGKSKEYNNKSLCSMPTKHGLGFRSLVRCPNGPALFGAWCALIQILSKHPKPRQGYLTRNGKQDGTPYTAQDLELLTDIPAKVFDAMLQATAHESVGWLRLLHGDRTATVLLPQGGITQLNSTQHNTTELDPPKAAKDTEYSEAFEAFWKAYPRRVGKDAAYKVWKRRLPELPADMPRIVARHIATVWAGKEVQYIPHPATWLNQGRWADEVAVSQPTAPAPLGGGAYIPMRRE